jgi:hypothetical protein
MSALPSAPSDHGAGAAAGTAKDEAADLAASAAESTQQVAHVAKEQATQVAAQSAAQAKELLGQARAELSSQAGEQQQRAARSLRALGDELRTMTDHDGESGVATELAGQGAERAHAVAQWLEDREPGTVLTDLQELGRRRPLAFLAAAAGAGLLAGRLTRGIAAGPSDAPRQTPATSGPSDAAAAQGTGRPFASSELSGDVPQATLGAADYPPAPGLAQAGPADVALGDSPVGGLQVPR